MSVPNLPDLSVIAAQAVAALALAAPFLDSLAQGAGKELGAAGARKAGQLLAALRSRWQSDKNDKALQTLDLFQQDPPTFDAALAKLLLQTLETHPEWAAEVQALLADDSLQEIVARNDSEVARITMTLSGSGTQRIEADNSSVTDVKMTRK